MLNKFVLSLAMTLLMTREGILSSDEFVYASANYSREGVNRAIWFVIWSRVTNGIHYRQQGINVSVNAATGAVFGYSVNVRTPEGRGRTGCRFPPASAFGCRSG